MHKSALMLSLAPTVEARQRTSFYLTTPRQTRSTQAFILQEVLCSWKEQRQSNRAHSTPLLQRYQLPKYHLKKTFGKTEGNWHLVSYVRVRAPAPSTATKNMLGYSTRNSKPKNLEPHFQFSGGHVRCYEYELLLLLQQNILGYSIRKDTANSRAWNHIYNFQEDTETAVALPHTPELHQRAHICLAKK